MRLNRPPSVGHRRNQEVVSQVRASRSGCYLLLTLGQLLGHHPSLPRLRGIHWLRVLVFRRHLLKCRPPLSPKSWLLPLLPALLYLHFLDPGWPSRGDGTSSSPSSSSSSVFFVGKGGTLTFRALCLLPPLF